MTEIQNLLAALKGQLKVRGLTYRDIAVTLDLSEASVKRLLSTGNLSLKRLADICHILDLSLADLTHTADSLLPRLGRLQEKQEAELVSDPQLLLVAVCALNHWHLSDIARHYRLDEPEVLRHLLRLDRMRLIDLLPGNRIRINVTRDFDWLPGGPIERFFAQHGRDDFLSGTFNDQDEPLFFVHGMLTLEARTKFMNQLAKLRRQFARLHEESQSAAIGERRGTAMLLAMREWEPPDFAELRRLNSKPGL